MPAPAAYDDTPSPESTITGIEPEICPLGSRVKAKGRDLATYCICASSRSTHNLLTRIRFIEGITFSRKSLGSHQGFIENYVFGDAITADRLPHEA